MRGSRRQQNGEPKQVNILKSIDYIYKNNCKIQKGKQTATDWVGLTQDSKLRKIYEINYVWFYLRLDCLVCGAMQRRMRHLYRVRKMCNEAKHWLMIGDLTFVSLLWLSFFCVCVWLWRSAQKCSVLVSRLDKYYWKSWWFSGRICQVEELIHNDARMRC